MRSREFVSEKWSQKYKRSINCNNPKGFSQRAHCQGRKKKANEGKDTNKFINNALKKAGYKFIGSGYDAQVWMKDEGTVVKILLPKENNEALETFETFYQFVKKHPKLPNLPKFKKVDGYEVYDFNVKGKPYKQYGMEQLHPLKTNSLDEWVVWMMADLSANQKNWDEARDIMSKEKDKHAKEFVSQNDKKMKEYNLLYNTLRLLHKVGIKRGYGWDPHTENIMQRNDGTLVITDPWA
jgi:hypothetical protein